MSENNMPLVSVCIPTYNGGKTIGRTIKSLLNQTYTNLEIIVNDDCSTDDTEQRVLEINDPRVKFSKNEKNKRFAGNWNECVKYVTGKYYKLICQDDLLFPNTIEKQVSVMEKYPNVAVVTGGSNVIDENNKIIMKRQKYRKDTIVDGKKFAKNTFWGRNNYGEPASLLTRTRNLSEEAKYDGDVLYCIDWDFAMNMSYYGDVYYIAEPIAQFRIAYGSVTVSEYQKKKNNNYLQHVGLFKKHQAIGKIKLTKFDEIKFKTMVKAYSFARKLVINRMVKK